MATQKILIDPMVPHYIVNDSSTNSKGGKASRNTSITTKEEAEEQDTVELAPIEDPKDEAENHMPDILKQAEKDGTKQAMQEVVRENRRNTFKFYGLMNKSEKVIHKIKNIVPFLHGEVIIDTAKVTFIHRPFFFSERIHAISVKDITDVYVETAPFFATLNVVDANFAENIVTLNWFWKKDAEKARRIITGLMATSKEQVDLKNVEEDDLDEKLEKIGNLNGTRTSVSAA